MPYITEDEYIKHLEAMVRSPYLVLDTEGTLKHRPFSETWGISTCTENGISEYFAFKHMLGENLPIAWLPRLAQVIENHPVLVMHNSKHDLRALSNWGIVPKGRVYCTMLMVHMVNENIPSKELDYLSKMMGFEGKFVTPAMQAVIDAFGWEYIPVDVMRKYAAVDAVSTKGIFKEVKPEFDSQDFDGAYWDLEQEFVDVIGELEDAGIVLNQPLCEKEYERGTGIMKDIRWRLGFNPGSSKELGHFLLNEMNMPVVKRNKKTNNASFDKDAMEIYDELLGRVNDTRGREVLIYRGWQKTTSTNYKNYLEQVYPDGRLRPNYKIHGTVTSRMSCSYFQQIPRSSSNDWNGNLKAAFIEDPDFMSWELDYSQLEFRLGLVYAIKSGMAGPGEQRLIEIFADPSRDVFNEMGYLLKMKRQDVKTLQYTLQYGGGVDRIHEVFGVSSAAAQAIRNNYYRNYPGFGIVAEVTKETARDRGWIRYWSGRRRHFPYKSEARKAGNSLTQGGAAEIIKQTTVEIKRKGLITPDCRLNLQVHDSLRFEIRRGKENEYLPEIKETMQDVKLPWDTGVKFKVEVNKWGTEEKWAA